MTRESLMINIRYSFQLETMQATLCNRLDRCFAFVQIILGSVIWASYSFLPPHILPLLGAIITVISVAGFALQPGRTAILCDIQARKMKALLSVPHDLPDEDLRVAFLKTEEGDNPVFGILRDAAYKRALTALGYASDAKLITLTLAEKIVAWMAGDLPKDD